MDYEEYEKQCKEIRAENDNLLKIFEEDLKSKGLSEQTIGRHISNVDFYINEYLLREDARTMEEGVAAIDTFLGYFFIRKCMWSTPGTIKSTAASIKKFYKSMVDHGKVKKSHYEFLCSEIKDGMEGWQEDCVAYNDPDAANPFCWF